MKVQDFAKPLYEARPSMAGQDFRTRVTQGKQMEAVIIKKLQEKGLKVRNASRREDMHDKIDLWVSIQNTWRPVQIKQREAGDDIIFEVYKDAYDETAPPNGRDYLGKAEFYVAVDTRGQGFVVSTAALKKAADAYLHQFGIQPGEYEGAIFKTTYDRSSGQPKLMAFFPPSRYGKRIF